METHDRPEADLPGRRSILRGLARHWWTMVALWVILAGPAVFLIQRFVEPTYEAASLLRVERSSEVLFDPTVRSTLISELQSYLRTQVNLLKSNQVLEKALAHPEVDTLPMVRAWKEPVDDLRRELEVKILGDDTSLIKVSMGSRDPTAAAAIVNAVVQEYIEAHNNDQRNANLALRKRLTVKREATRREVDHMMEKFVYLLTQRAAQGDVREEVPPPGKPGEKAEDGEVRPSFSTLTEKQLDAIADRLLRADFDLMDAQARLEAARLPGAQASPERLRGLESAVEEARRKRDLYARYFTRAKDEKPRPPVQEKLEADLLNQDLHHMKRLLEILDSKIAQLDIELGGGTYRADVVDRAAVPKVPSSNRRPAYMTAAALGIYLLILGAFLIREVAARPGVGPQASAGSEG